MSAILIVLTSHPTLGDTGRPTGYYVSEAAEPWRTLTAAGHTVDLASIAGGEPPSDGSWDGFDDFRAAIAPGTRPVAGVAAARYDAVLLAGGHGTMWDFPESAALSALIAEVYGNGGVVAAVCHGPAGLTEVRLPSGRPLVEGHEVAAFTDAEEAAVALTGVVPFSLQQRLTALGAVVRPAEPFAAHVIRSGRLVTGQNPASAAGVAEAVLEALRDRSPATVTASYFAAEHRRDLDGILAHFAPAIRFTTPDGQALHGRAELRDFYAANLAALPELRVWLLDDVTAGARSALRWRAEGRTPDGTTLHMHGTNVVTVADGFFTDFDAYWLTMP